MSLLTTMEYLKATLHLQLEINGMLRQWSPMKTSFSVVNVSTS